MKGESRPASSAPACRRSSAAAVILLAAHPASPLLGPAPVTGGTFDVGGTPPAARR
jgi:hypothetical protein